MNPTELLDQFVAEAREGLDTIGQLLLAAEKRSGDASLINDLFRGVHTLKGNCGLFEFKPLETVVHAGEDVLDRVRNGQLVYSAPIADALLEMLDFAIEMVQAIEAGGQLPDSAAPRAATLAKALRAQIGGVAAAPGAAAAAPPATRSAAHVEEPPDWAARVPAQAQAGGGWLLRYRPEPDCFFKGEDPWRLALDAPGLVQLDLVAAEPWPQPEAFDCYRCNLDIVLLCQAERAALEQHFRYVPEQVAWFAAAPPAASPAQRLLRERIAVLWREQVALLHEPDGHAGTCAAARGVLVRLLAAAGQPAEVPAGDAATLAAWAMAHEFGAGAAARAPAPSAGAAQDEHTEAAAARGADADHGAAGAAGRVLKVAQEKVDTLMDLIGEMVVAKNSLSYLSERAEQVFGQRELAREIKTQYSVINRIAEDMQRTIMQVRMLPVGTVFQRFPRLVRDISRKLGKQVNLVVEGEDTEADKNVIEALADPLIHIIRNSLDHGIEVPARRTAAGKAEAGTIRVAARQEGDRVVLEIADDGAGIDPQRVKAKALDRELISDERAAQMSDAEAVQLVFAPGFSTAEAITDLSGRGVGMDVVRTAVERINGTVALESRLGHGTTITLKLPLSMAVSHVMTIEAAGRRFGIPMDLIVETVRVNIEDIHAFKQARTTVLRSRVVPLRALHDLLSLDAAPLLNAEREQAVLVVRMGSESVGLVVDDFHGTSDIILKPLEGVLAGHTGIAGTALMGDGNVLLVLNPKELLS